VALGNEIQRIRSVFKYAYDAEMVDRPIRFGPGFKRPSKKTMRKNKAQKGPKLFAAEEIRQLLGLSPWAPAAGVQLSAMILLGINAGCGNSDCATLPLKAIDLDGGWVNYARPKTGLPRRCALVQLVHPNIVRVQDLGEHDGLPFVIMQYLSGGSLRDRFPTGADDKYLPMLPEQLHAWLPAIADALDTIHGMGFLHRDGKPHNILFDQTGRAYLSDLGLVRGTPCCASIPLRDNR
jgi:serine/threonine protein kinase